MKSTVGEIALAAPATTRVFEKYHIDYCCGGRRPLDEACASAGVETAAVIDSLDQVLNANDVLAPLAPEKMHLSDLADHIVGTHHIFTAEELERLEPLMAKVATRHGELHPELYEIESIFRDLKSSLLPHMQREENILFPYIRDLAAGTAQPPHFGTVKNPVRMMMVEHETDGERLRQMRSLANDYGIPEGACPSFAALYAGLDELEHDLHRHIHLENNVLFPRAIELENGN
jgi:regulator of cell morphogenesis and NO signaling